MNFSNPCKLHVLAGGSLDNKHNAIDGQVCLYEPGVGAQSSLRSVRKARFGLGILKQQTKPMWKKLTSVYEEGDQIYIVGFSRGASSARKFVNELNEKGINGKSVPVAFVGCFDTVSMQVSKNLFKILSNRGKFTHSTVLGETEGKLPDNVQQYVHHVSLDDNRFDEVMAFCPVLMDSKNNKVHEAWFPGEHGDVGGYFYERGISDISCKAMQEWLEDAGIEFIPADKIRPESIQVKKSNLLFSGGGPDIQIDPLELAITPDASDKVHGKREVPTYRPVATMTNEEVIEGGIPKVHVSVMQHYQAMEAKKTPYEMNPEIKKANFVLVDNRGNVLQDKTEEFKNLL